jgi:2-polyprenyl-3-methyl-5-hydroxy-6-metoxy-1,4-benzoquinol methylase
MCAPSCKTPVDHTIVARSKVTVRLDRPSCYRGSQAGSYEDLLCRIRLWLSYFHYRHIMSRYLPVGGQDKAIVEIGCGPGYLLSFIEKWFPQYEVIGLDFDFRLLGAADQRTERSHLVKGNAEELPFGNSEFDVLVTLHLIEHLYHPERFFAEANRVLRPNGVLLLATPNPTGIGARVMKSGWVGWREDHVSLYSPQAWTDLVECCGFTWIRGGTTMLSGLPIFRKFPLAVVNYLPLLLFGVLPWEQGEAFVGLFRRI